MNTAPLYVLVPAEAVWSADPHAAGMQLVRHPTVCGLQCFACGRNEAVDATLASATRTREKPFDLLACVACSVEQCIACGDATYAEFARPCMLCERMLCATCAVCVRDLAPAEREAVARTRAGRTTYVPLPVDCDACVACASCINAHVVSVMPTAARTLELLTRKMATSCHGPRPDLLATAIATDVVDIAGLPLRKVDLSRVAECTACQRLFEQSFAAAAATPFALAANPLSAAAEAERAVCTACKINHCTACAACFTAVDASALTGDARTCPLCRSSSRVRRDRSFWAGDA